MQILNRLVSSSIRKFAGSIAHCKHNVNRSLTKHIWKTTAIRNCSIMSQSPHKVCIIGSGNWGSAIARIVGENTAKLDQFETNINMWVFEEMVDGKKLTEIINTDHENVKYLPGHKLPTNVIAVPDIKVAVEGASILVFVVPHQFVAGLCTQLKGIVTPDTIAVSLIKGLNIKDKGLQLISHLVNSSLGIDCNVLMGANLAPEVASGNFCEATIGIVNEKHGAVLKDLFQTDTFRIVVVEDATTVELCGALKNIVAVGAGIVDGLGYGDNTKAAVIRLGLMEMVKFAQTFYEGTKTDTFLESCGVADLVTTCYGGRNRRVAEAFVRTKKPIKQLEQEMLNGQSLQGPHTAYEVNVMLKDKDMEDKYPLFTAVYKICREGMPPEEMIHCLHDHPEHL